MAKVKLERPSAGGIGPQFFVQAMIRDGRRTVPGQGQRARDEADAIRMANNVASRSAGVIAYEVELDADGELISEPRIILAKGKVPGLQIETTEEPAEA